MNINYENCPEKGNEGCDGHEHDFLKAFVKMGQGWMSFLSLWMCVVLYCILSFYSYCKFIHCVVYVVGCHRLVCQLFQKAGLSICIIFLFYLE
jgi:hypothetical protein